MDLHELLDQYLGVPIEAAGGNELRYMCPFNGCLNQKLFVNDNPKSERFGQWICFECGGHGSLTGWLTEGVGMSYSDAKQAISDAGIVSQGYSRELTPEENILLLLDNRQETPEKHMGYPLHPRLPAPEVPYGLHYFSEHREDAKPFLSYLRKRGFSEDLVTALGYGYIVSGYTTTSKGRLNIYNHVVFFTYQHGRYKYWNTRSIDNGIPKSINAPSDGKCLGKGDLIYNLDYAVKNKLDILTEGVPDALTLFPYGVATFGKMVSDIQLGILSRIPKDIPILIMLDMDAKDQLCNLASQLYRDHKNTYMVFNPTKQDANSLGREKAFKVIKEKGNLILPSQEGVLEFNIRMREI